MTTTTPTAPPRPTAPSVPHRPGDLAWFFGLTFALTWGIATALLLLTRASH